MNTFHHKFFEKLLRHKELNPTKTAFRIINKDMKIQDEISQESLWGKASGIAWFIRDRLQLPQNSRVLLVYPPSADFHAYFLGCLVAGVIPVPLPPPNPFKGLGQLKFIYRVAQQTDCETVFSTSIFSKYASLSRFGDSLTSWGNNCSKLKWINTDQLEFSGTRLPDFSEPPNTAFLQYTSGSTSAPKGVMISYENIVHQCKSVEKRLAMQPHSRCFTWVPHFHDFGLISGILLNLYCGTELTMMSPLDFLKKPLSWFDAVDKFRISHTAAPNFAFEVILKKLTGDESWDLSCLKIIMNAAEPISAKSMRIFKEKFATFGMNPQAFCPAFGLAEHAVGVSVGSQKNLFLDRQNTGPLEKIKLSKSQGFELHSSGVPLEGVDIRIVNPYEFNELDDGQVGEVWVTSQSKAPGYWGLEKESRETFDAKISNQISSDQTYLRTGDLGFLWEENLYITGRLKDLLIVNGKNIYPQDIEAALKDNFEELRPGSIAAISINGRPKDSVVILAEMKSKSSSKKSLKSVKSSVSSFVLSEFSVEVRDVILGKKNMLPKTTSGKLRRTMYKEQYLNGSYS